MNTKGLAAEMHFRAITRIVGLLVILFRNNDSPGLVALIYRDGAGIADLLLLRWRLAHCCCGGQTVVRKVS